MKQWAVWAIVVGLDILGGACREDDCVCTLKACDEGLIVHYTLEVADKNSLDALELAKYELACEVDGTTYHANPAEVIGPDSGDVVIDFHLGNAYLREHQPKSVSLVLSYNDDVLFKDDSVSLSWETGVCNSCSGGDDCHDDMWERAIVELQE